MRKPRPCIPLSRSTSKIPKGGGQSPPVTRSRKTRFRAFFEVVSKGLGGRGISAPYFPEIFARLTRAGLWPVPDEVSWVFGGVGGSGGREAGSLRRDWGNCMTAYCIYQPQVGSSYWPGWGGENWRAIPLKSESSELRSVGTMYDSALDSKSRVEEQVAYYNQIRRVVGYRVNAITVIH